VDPLRLSSGKSREGSRSLSSRACEWSARHSLRYSGLPLRRKIVKPFSGVEGFGREREGKERKKGFADRFAVTLTRVMFEFLLFVLIWEGVAESAYGVNQSSWGEGNGVKWERKLLSHGRIEQTLLDSSFPASS
ncbi:unnamed protein product, partial [Musa hybrid cultivar]